MYKLISDNCVNYKSKIAYTLCDDGFTSTITYQQLLQESNKLKNIFQTFPKNICIGIYMRNNPCVPMIIYSLLEYQITFILLDPDKENASNLKTIWKLKLYAIITCSINFVTDIFPYQTKKNVEIETDFGCKLLFHISCDISSYFCLYENICYIVQTSGSMGEPKYVKVTEDCIRSNILSLRQKLNTSHDDVIYFGTPFTFDPCYVELLLALTTGASLLATTKEIRNKPSILLQKLFKNCGLKTSVLQMCPSVFLRWSEEEIIFIFNETDLKILALGGEPFPEYLLQFKRKSDLKLFNLYGITEMSCWASACHIVDDIHLSDVLDDTIFEVRDTNGKVVQDGEGVLFIGSTTRLCYVDDEKPSETNCAIFRSTGDIVKVKNNIYQYRGRSNSIIKRFGHRINLNLLENNITATINLINKCIWHVDLQKISCFIIVTDFTDNTKDKIIDKIRNKLLKNISSAYFPDHIDLIREIPLTQNGKINVKKLEMLGMEVLTKKISEIPLILFRTLWCKFFGLTKDQADEKNNCKFFEMGGTSIMYAQFINEMKQMNIQFDQNILIDGNFYDVCKYLQNTCPQRESNGYFKISWSKYLFGCVDTTATIIEKFNKAYVAIGNFSNLFAIFDTITGEEVSKIWLPNVIENSCQYSPIHDSVFVGAFDGYMYCLELETSKIIWKFKTNDRVKNVGCLTLNGTAMVFGSYDHYLYLVNIQTGELIWKNDFGEGITAGLKCECGKIYVGGIKGKIACLHETNGSLLWTSKSKYPIFASFEIVNNETLILSDIGGYIYCIDCENGKIKWLYEPATYSMLYSSVLIHKNFIIFGMIDKNIYILEFNDIECILKFSICTNHEVSAKPAILNKGNNDYIIIVTTDGYIFLYKFYNTSLDLIECMNLNDKCYASPVICDNNLYLGCRDNNFYCININI